MNKVGEKILKQLKIIERELSPKKGETSPITKWWFNEKLSKHLTLLGKMSSTIFKKIKNFERSDGASDRPCGRFSEAWFRTSGIYKLDAKYQNDFIDCIIDNISQM